MILKLLKKRRINLELFLTGLMQVILVCLNTYQIAAFVKYKSPTILIGIFIIGFLISLLWSFNVKKVAFGNLINRVWYAVGAAFGSVIGVIIGYIIY
jgi:hypothetical protein